MYLLSSIMAHVSKERRCILDQVGHNAWDPMVFAEGFTRLLVPQHIWAESYGEIIRSHPVGDLEGRNLDKYIKSISNDFSHSAYFLPWRQSGKHSPEGFYWRRGAALSILRTIIFHLSAQVLVSVISFPFPPVKAQNTINYSLTSNKLQALLGIVLISYGFNKQRGEMERNNRFIEAPEAFLK